MVWLRCEIPSLALGAAVGQKKGGHGVTMGRHGGLPLHVDWYGGGRAMAKIRLTMESFGYAQDRPKLEASASAPSSVLNRQGESPCQTEVARFAADRNCVAVRPGGEQREAERQSTG